MEPLEQQLAGLSPAQHRLVELWLRQKQVVADPAPPSRAIPRLPASSAPLSFAQQRIWFLNQLEPASPAYNLRTAVRLVGRLDVALLERSLNAIVQRHEALRTTFLSVNGQPQQVIAPTLSISLPVVTLDHLPLAERDAQLLERQLQDTEQPFDLEHGPLLRTSLLRLGAEEHVLLLTMHHIISDGWSQGVQLHELAALYAAFAHGKPSPLPELPIQYADYVLWQRDWLQGSILDEQLVYWKTQLEPLPHVLDLSTDRPRPVVATSHGAWAYFTVSASLLDQLKNMSRREGVTLFMTLLATFDLLLYRYTGQCDLVVGSPVAGRTRSELEGLIGCFVNMLALRTQLDEDPPVRELLQRVRTVTLGAYGHQDLPFEKLVEELQVARDLSRNPIFQVMLALQNTPMPALQGPGLTLEPMEVNSTSSTLDLSWYLREQMHELQIRVEYNTDLFDAATIMRMLGHFQTLLNGIVAAPGQRLADLPLLTDRERRQLLDEWNATQSEYPHDQCIHQLFEAQVARTPDAIMVVFDSWGDKETRRQGDRRQGDRRQETGGRT
jgi:hypothetical protein